MKLYKRMTAARLGVSLSLAVMSTVADDMDVLGQFLEQNFPTQQDPLEVLAINKAEQVEAQAMMVGSLLSPQSALVTNNKAGEVLYQKNASRVVPIVLISKLMSAIVLLDVDLNMNELVMITPEGIDRSKGTGSRLSIGTLLPRKELLHLSLVSNEGRATHALARTHPGGINAFVIAMNARARSLDMSNSHFYEPTGSGCRNVPTTYDLSCLVAAISKCPLIRRNPTSSYGAVSTTSGSQCYRNSNALVHEGGWNIELQKTGYTREVGRSVVVKASVQN